MGTLAHQYHLLPNPRQSYANRLQRQLNRYGWPPRLDRWNHLFRDPYTFTILIFALARKRVSLRGSCPPLGTLP